MNRVEYYQQGDVLLKRVEKLPDGLQKFNGYDKALQHGESTGHMHRFPDTSPVTIYVRPDHERVLLNDGRTIVPGFGKFIIIEGKTEQPLSHEEHRTIMVPPGIYEMDLVREYDYDRDEMARVID